MKSGEVIQQPSSTATIMSSQKRQGEELEGDITFVKTTAQVPSKFGTGESCGVETTNVSTTERPVLGQFIQLTPISLELTLC